MTAKDVPRKVSYFRFRNGETPVLPTPSPAPSDDINTGVYADTSCVSLAPVSSRMLFVYGGNVKQADNSKVNYKTKIYYTKLQASNIVTVDKKGRTKTKKGKLVEGITCTNIKPSIVKGRISKDAAASKIAKASISKGKIKVTAQKETGVVYLWVMDTGDAGAYACARIVIKAAPSKLQVFAKPASDTGFSADKKDVYKKDVIEIGDSVRIYVYPTYKQGGQLKETKDASYSASINSAASSYFTVTQDADNPYCFIVTAIGLKNNKKTAGKITVKCNENGKKTVFTAYAVNGVQGISFSSLNGITEDVGTVSGSAVVSYTVGSSDTEKKTGSFVISISKKSDGFDTTDKVKMYAMGSENGFDKEMMEKGRVKITSRPSGEQKKLKAKLDKDKKTVTVTAEKKVPSGTAVYYLIMYNNKENTGYKVVKITAV